EVRHLLEERSALRCPHPAQRLETRRREKGCAAAAAGERHAHDGVRLRRRRDARDDGAGLVEPGNRSFCARAEQRTCAAQHHYSRPMLAEEWMIPGVTNSNHRCRIRGFNRQALLSSQWYME